jgi:[ribosomal protein S5]-alanine N-acetyltransferase
VIGTVGAFPHGYYHGCYELAWALSRPHWRQGLMFEAANCLVSRLLEEKSIHSLFAQCDERNHASVRLMEKLGVKQEGLHHQALFLKGEWVTMKSYRLVTPTKSREGEGLDDID